ncbi:MAG: hypothetical protein ACT4PJ_14655 [Gemmatimonadaceae bacterium]
MESTRIFVRDGFIDRYTGTRVIFPPDFLVPQGGATSSANTDEWDGLLGWFLRYVAARPDLSLKGRLGDWHAARTVVAERR